MVAFSPDVFPWPGEVAPPPLKTSTITTWTYSLSHIPIDPTATTSSVWVGVIGQDGSIREVAPANR